MEFGTYQLANIPFQREAKESLDQIDYLGLPNGGRFLDDSGYWYPIQRPSVIFGTRTSRKDGKNRYQFWNEWQLQQQRDAARFLADNDPLAIGVLGQLVNFTVGDEAQVVITPKKKAPQGTEQAAQIVQNRVDSFKERISVDSGYTTTFEEYCREYALTSIIDGEKYDRIYCTPDGAVVRRIEPEQITQPPGATDAQGWHLGVWCEPGDIAKRKAFYVTYAPGEVRGETVPVGEIFQYTRNTPSTVVRGVSDMMPVSDDLADIGRLIDGIRVGSKVKSKIAYLRSLKAGSQSIVEGFVAKTGDTNPPSPLVTPGSGRNGMTRETLPPGSIINVGDNVDFKTMPQGATQEYLEAANFCIRTVIGVRWNLPEYMINSDSSNNNYASLLAAGGPSVRAFKSNQSAIAARIRLIVKRVLEYDQMLGFLPLGILDNLDIVIKFPTPVVTDPLADAQVKSIELERKVRSRKSWQMASGLDPEEEDAQIMDDQEKFGQMATPLPELTDVLSNAKSMDAIAAQ